MDIKVEGDAWLAGSENNQVQVNPVTCAILEKVYELMEGPCRQWNKGLINKLFSPHHASAILVVPLCSGRHDDQWIWCGNNKGIYSLKSGYYVAHDSLFNKRCDGGCCNLLVFMFWDKVWCSTLPPKFTVNYNIKSKGGKAIT
ncbi:hypothetical protein ACFE04_020250 [Oxalis oulophora]